MYAMKKCSLFIFILNVYLVWSIYINGLISNYLKSRGRAPNVFTPKEKRRDTKYIYLMTYLLTDCWILLNLFRITKALWDFSWPCRRSPVYSTKIDRATHLSAWKKGQDCIIICYTQIVVTTWIINKIKYK